MKLDILVRHSVLGVALGGLLVTGAAAQSPAAQSKDTKDANKSFMKDSKDANKDLKNETKDANKDLKKDAKDANKDLKKDAKDASKGQHKSLKHTTVKKGH
jgi:F0F1-type ATP synthase membrane subunit b/b'